MSLTAYQQASVRVEDPRETEYRLFGMVIRALTEVKAYDRTNLGALSSVIDWNKRIWNALAQDCADEGNGHNEALRAGIISLAIFVEKYSTQVIRDGADIDTLIDINRTVMQGLAPASTQSSQASATSAAPATAAQA